MNRSAQKVSAMKMIMKPMVAAIAAMLLLPAMVQGADSKNQGYLVDTYGNNVTMSGTNLCWRDSDWTPARSVEPCDPVNKPVAAAPVPPAPRPVAVAEVAPALEPAKPLPQKISFSGDALFAFDKAVLKPEGKVMLDGLVNQLEGATYDNIIATGHTDRFGSNAYNQKLSERRAQAVKDHLVGKNVQASRIDAEGRGEAQPVTKPGDCRGAKSARVVACLQPDRRVDVEMKGSKTVTGSR
ncbi:MAG: OmpA family protein [Burkholderiales bacterium]|nr:OmpA family protein [Burkholderiales bacterium]